MSYKILTINPGSTSTKVGFFDGEELKFSVNVSHDAAKLAEFAGISDQLPYRKEIILAELEKAGIDLSTVERSMPAFSISARIISFLYGS